jgi:exonuclease III
MTFFLFLSCCTSPPLAICLTETWLSDSNDPAMFNINGYTFYHLDRKSRGGGVAAYISSTIQVEVLPATELLECLNLKMKLPVFGTVHLLVVYNAPINSKPDFCNRLERTLEHLNSKNVKALVTGDLNINTLDPKNINCMHLSTSITSNGYKHLITIPTRTTPTSSTCIDHMITNIGASISGCGTVNFVVTDHEPIFANLCTDLKEKSPRREPA